MIHNKWCEGIVLRYCIHKLKLRAGYFGLLAFAGYWGLPFLFSAYQKTLLSNDGAHQLVDQLTRHPRIALVVSPMLGGTRPLRLRNGYLEDRNHFIFAIILCVGGMMVPMILRRIGETFNALIQEGIVPDSLRLRSEYQSHRAWANHWLTRLFSLGIAALIFVTFYTFSLDPRNSQWWGSLSFGVAGLSLAAIEFFMVYFGTQAIINIAFGSMLIGRVVAQDIEPRLFHHDGCGGMSGLGGLIVMLWIFVICLAGEILVTLKLGYFGIENRPETWLLAFTGICSFPLMAIYPLFSCVRSLHHVKTRELRSMEPAIVALYTDAKRFVANKQFDLGAEAAGDVGKLKSIHHQLHDMNVWPFNTRAIFLVVGIYSFQFFLTMRELFGNR